MANTSPANRETTTGQPTKQEDFSAWPMIKLLGGIAVLSILLSISINILKVARTVDTRAIYLGLDGLRLPIAVTLTVLVTTIGVLLWKRPRFSVVCAVLAVMGGLGFGATKLVRVESFYGNMVPRLAWVWEPATEEAFANYDSEQATQTLVVATQEARPLQLGSQDFPGFLGAARDGVITGVDLDPDWENNAPRELWRKPIGVSWASFSVVDHLAFTQEQRGEFESVVAYDLLTGDEVWVHTDAYRFTDEHGDGPRAVPTFHQGKLLTLGAGGLLNCLDASTGELIWQQATLEDPEKQNLLWGMTGCPLIYNDLVIVSPGGGEGESLKAYAIQDGQLRWSTGDDRAAYASPALVTLAGQQQIMVFNGAGLRGYDVNGQPLWLFPWITQGDHQRVNVAQPIVLQPHNLAGDSSDELDQAGYVLISSGYGNGTALLRVSPDAEGQWNAEEVWLSKTLKSKMSNFVVHGEHIYGFDHGIFTSIRIDDGGRNWKKGRYGHGQVLLVDDVLLVQAESGEIHLVEATPERFNQLATLPALEGKSWNHAALAGNLLVIRNDREAVCYELGRK